MRIRALLTNLTLTAAAAAIGLLLAEFAARLVLDPSDHLSVEMVRDDVLGAVPSSGGFDAWGFRNRAVPERADIVAIGDSHTYGNTATMEESWPYVLARLSGKRVYNMGMGGYGPNQYYHLLTTRALELKPRAVLVGLYIGDDFENAFLITYGLEHWAALRTLPPEHVNFDIWQEPPAPNWHKKVRNWLSRHSVVYQLVFHGPLLGRFQGELQIKGAGRSPDSITSLSIPEKNILEAFRPRNMLRVLDQSNESVREGMRITFALLKDMNDVCQRNGVRFLVVVIPTKEMVFAEHLEHKPELALRDVLDNLLANERLARERTFKFLVDAQIGYIDTLPALRRALDKQLYVRTATDMHPGRNGYEVVGRAVFEALQQDDAH